MTTASSPTALMTAEEFFARYPNHHVELVRGVVREVPMPGGRHGGVTARLTGELYVYLRANDIGHVVCNDTYVITGRDPDTVLGMDVGFISYTRIPRGPLPDGPLPVAPELAVEVRSPSDAWTEVFAKAEEYFSAGVSVVLIIDPERRVVAVCHPGPVQQDLTVADTLTLPDILPGFSVPVARLFG
jgi:Uma2 family endonuclease